MIDSVIFRTTVRAVMPVLLIASILMLVRGHDEPGGGFIGGLFAAIGFALYALSNGVRPAQALLRVEPLTIVGVGLGVAALSGVPAMLLGEPYMTSLWSQRPKIGTPLLFDVGVYLVVLGTATQLVFTLVEE